MSKTVKEIVSNKIKPTASNRIEQVEGKQNEIAKNPILYVPKLKSYIGDISKSLLNTLIGKITTRNWMTDTEQSAKILFPATEIGGYVSITNTLRSDTVNIIDPTIKPIIVHFKQKTGLGHSDWNHPPIGRFISSIDVPRYWRNIDNRTGMNPQGPIVTLITESNRENNCNIFDLVRRTSDITYRRSMWHVTMKSESENLRGNKIIENAKCENNIEVEKVGHKNSVNWNHTDLIINWNQNIPTGLKFIQITPTQINPFHLI